MCTIALSYDSGNAYAQSKLLALLETGLFKSSYIEPKAETASGRGITPLVASLFTGRPSAVSDDEIAELKDEYMVEKYL